MRGGSEAHRLIAGPLCWSAFIAASICSFETVRAAVTSRGEKIGDFLRVERAVVQGGGFDFGFEKTVGGARMAQADQHVGFSCFVGAQGILAIRPGVRFAVAIDGDRSIDAVDDGDVGEFGCAGSFGRRFKIFRADKSVGPGDPLCG